MKITSKLIVILSVFFFAGLYSLPVNAGKSYFSLKDRAITFEAVSVTDTVTINTNKIKKKKAKGVKPQAGIIFSTNDLPSVLMNLNPLIKKRKRLKIEFIFVMEKDNSLLKGEIKNVKLRIKNNGTGKIIVPLDEGIERSVFYKIKSPSLKAKGIRETHGYLANDSQGPLITDGAGLLQFVTEVFKDKIVESVNKIPGISISEPQLSGTFDLTISIKGTNFAIETDDGKFKKTKIFKGKIEVQ